MVLSLVGLGCSFETDSGNPQSGMTVGDTEASGMTGSTDPSATTGSVDPSGSTDPSGSSDPSGPTDPTGPTDPSTPTDPSGLTDPSTTDDSTTTGSSTTSDEGTSGTTEDEVESSSSTGEAPFELCDDSLVALRACYDFAAADSGTLSDGSTHGNDGMTVGVALEPGPFGGAARFGQNSLISVPDSAPLDLPGDLTYEAWLRLDSLPESGRVGILDNDGQYSLMVYAGQGFRCSAAGADLFFANVPTEQWVHVACVHAGSDLSLWLDGTLAANAASNGSLLVENEEAMSLGDTSPDFDEPIDGRLAAVRVWNVARSAEEIAEAAAAGR